MRSFRGLLVTTALFLSGRAYGQVFTYTTTADFDGGTKVRLVDSAPAPADQLQLGPAPVSTLGFVWSTNYYPGYVVKLRTSDGKQVARYDSALQTIGGVATGARPPGEMCNWSNLGNCPGRIAVDGHGDAWIVNRAFGQQGTVTRIAGDPARCVDRNGNGTVETSTDGNGDGLIDIASGSPEFLGQNDECILTTFPVGPPNVAPRGVAVDRHGKVWVSTFYDGKLYRYDPTTTPPTLEASVTVAANSYSIAAGGDYLVVSNSGGVSSRVHVVTLAVTTAPCPGNYGVVASTTGAEAWLGSYFVGTSGIYRAAYGAGTCTLFANGGVGATTAMTLDGDGNVWSANYSNATVSKHNSAGALLGTYPAGGSYPHGLSVDFDGNLWVVLDGSSSLSKINTVTGALLGTYSLGGPGVSNAAPYSYADFTGVQLVRFAPYAPDGLWTRVADGGAAGIAWATVTWNTEAEGAVPTGATLQVRVRAADDLPALDAAPFTPVVASGDPLAGIVGRYLEVEVVATGGAVTPVLSDLSVVGPCLVVGDACCVSAADCDDADLCTVDSCAGPGSLCTHEAIAGCCNVAADCSDGDLCTTDSCSGPGGSCGATPIAGCCNVSSECDDADLCTTDSCSGPGGTCTLTPIAGCCNADPDCDDADLCTSDSCSGPGGTCTLTPIAGCCNVDAECDDADLCTTDTCSGAGGTCTLAPIPGCCNADLECDDGDLCTTDSCSEPGGTCSQTPVDGCCNAAAECGDGDPCTTDTCTGPGGTCSHTPAGEGCCDEAADCDDGDACTTDACAAGMTCTHDAIAGCCAAAADCDDGNVCTTDSCAGAMCGNDPIAGCCTTDAECAGGTCQADHTCLAPPGGESSGCGCRVAPRAGAPLASVLPAGLLLALAVLLCRRKRGGLQDRRGRKDLARRE